MFDHDMGREASAYGYEDSEPAAVGGGGLDELSRIAGPAMALLATDRGVCGLVRWDADSGLAYDDGGMA